MSSIGRFAAWAVALVWVGGCGHLNAFNPDGLTHTDDPVGDTADPGDTDPGDTDPNDSDTQDPAGSAPTLVTFDARESGDRIEVAFRVTDPDNNIEGGKLELTINGVLNTLRIPQDISSWSPGGESKVFIPITVCDGGSSHSFSARAIDATGLASASKSDSLTLSGSGQQIPETGDDYTTAYDLGYLAFPAFLCGDMYRASNDGYEYTGDVDWVVFDSATIGYYTFTLSWTAAGSDYDMVLYDSYGDVAAFAVTDADSPPEVMDALLWPDDYYYLMVAGWSGSPGSWMVTVQ